MNKKLCALLLCLALTLGIAGCTPTATDPAPTSSAPTEVPAAGKLSFAAGTYTATVPGMHDDLTVEVEVTAESIKSVAVTKDGDTPGIREWPVEQIPQRIVESQSLAVDVVSGATFTSRAILRAAEQCLTEAGGDKELLKVKVEAKTPEAQEITADVIIVGGGGAGLAAAMAATQSGASVALIEKTGVLGGNSIVSGGIYNCADPELQSAVEMTDDRRASIEEALKTEPKNEAHAALIADVKAQYDAYNASGATYLFDTAEWHALQTYLGGDYIGDVGMIRVMTENALSSLRWLEENGMGFDTNIRQGAGALYQRTHFNNEPNGVGYINAFCKNLEGVVGYTQLMETTGESLIMDGDKVVGVNAVGKAGNAITLHANKSVILATGGFAGNVEMRQEYCQGEKWPDLGSDLITSNMAGVTGDGIRMAKEAGSELVNMEQIQLLQVCNPVTGSTGDIVSPYSSEGYLFINKEGNRFVREDGRRDVISKAILEQTDSTMYLVQSGDIITDPTTALSLDKRPYSYFLEKGIYGFTVADTLDDLAAELGMDPVNLKATIDSYNAHVESGEPDEFGRTLLKRKQENGPWYAYPRSPAAHHTMGGVNINENTQALRADGSVVEGLYCAGEITGVIHGGNRLGGNAIVDFVVFGRIAGTNAAK